MKKVNASHILVKTKEEAELCINLLKAGKTFEELATDKSLCSSKKRGGSLGWFSRGKMAKEFESACFSGKKGQIIGPVKTQFGYHVIRINDTE